MFPRFIADRYTSARHVALLVERRADKKVGGGAVWFGMNIVGLLNRSR